MEMPMSERTEHPPRTDPDTATGRQFADQLAWERPRLVRVCARLSGSQEAAEDLAQETLAEAWRHRDRLHEMDGLSSWTSAIARNVCKRWVRARGRQEVWDHDRAPAGFDLIDEGDCDADFDLEIELERRELAELLDRAMDRLTLQARAVLIQRYVEDLPHCEIAERLSLPGRGGDVRPTDLRVDAMAGDAHLVSLMWEPAFPWPA
jgi:RNA polymerase sigma factor (sigma-70 family)